MGQVVAWLLCEKLPWRRLFRLGGGGRDVGGSRGQEKGESLAGEEKIDMSSA